MVGEELEYDALASSIGRMSVSDNINRRIATPAMSYHVQPLQVQPLQPSYHVQPLQVQPLQPSYHVMPLQVQPLQPLNVAFVEMDIEEEEEDDTDYNSSNSEASESEESSDDEIDVEEIEDMEIEQEDNNQAALSTERGIMCIWSLTY
jgi:hypothetical protein